jgi:DNA-binding Lrp family transcriptional regulator
MRDPIVPIRDKAIYAVLSTYANSVSNEATITINMLAAFCNVTPSTICRSLKSLEDLGIIKRIQMGKGAIAKTILLK